MIRNKPKDLRYRSDRHTIHKFSATAHLFWAVSLLINPELVASGALAPLGAVAEIWVWCLWSGAISLIQYAGLGRFQCLGRLTAMMELIGAYLSLIWWGWIFFMFLIHGQWSTAEGTYFAIFVWSVRALWFVPSCRRRVI